MSVGFSKLLCSASQLVKKGFVRTQQQVRHGGGGPVKMNIVPSRWNDLQFREILAFYSIIVAAPLLAVTTYVNIFIGSAKLTPIPDGYEPKEEEYERHPISRWLHRNVFQDGQMLYETKLHTVWETWNFSHRAMLISEVKRVMESEGDYADWHYTGSDAKYARLKRREFEESRERTGTFV